MLCRNCNKTGHKASVCPDMLCFACNQKGHMSYKCPTLKDKPPHDHTDAVTATPTTPVAEVPPKKEMVYKEKIEPKGRR